MLSTTLCLSLSALLQKVLAHTSALALIQTLLSTLATGIIVSLFQEISGVGQARHKTSSHWGKTFRFFTNDGRHAGAAQGRSDVRDVI